MGRALAMLALGLCGACAKRDAEAPAPARVATAAYANCHAIGGRPRVIGCMAPEVVASGAPRLVAGKASVEGKRVAEGQIEFDLDGTDLDAPDVRIDYRGDGGATATIANVDLGPPEVVVTADAPDPARPTRVAADVVTRPGCAVSHGGAPLAGARGRYRLELDALDWPAEALGSSRGRPDARLEATCLDGAHSPVDLPDDLLGAALFERARSAVEAPGPHAWATARAGPGPLPAILVGPGGPLGLNGLRRVRDAALVVRVRRPTVQIGSCGRYRAASGQESTTWRVREDLDVVVEVAATGRRLVARRLEGAPPPPCPSRVEASVYGGSVTLRGAPPDWRAFQAWIAGLKL